MKLVLSVVFSGGRMAERILETFWIISFIDSDIQHRGRSLYCLETRKISGKIIFHKMFLYSLKLLLNTFSAWEDIWRAVLKMSAERFFNSSCKLPNILLSKFNRSFASSSVFGSNFRHVYKNCEKRLLVCLSVCLSARMKHLGSHSAALREIFILSIFF